MEESPEWFVVINPKAGGGRSVRKWKSFKPLLDQSHLNYRFSVTAHAGHSASIIDEALKKGHNNFLAVGGDGTLNEVVNGIYNSGKTANDLIVAQLAIGTGNDWIKSQDNRSKTDLELVRKMGDPVKYVFDQDIGKIVFPHGEREPFYFVNMLGAGFSGKVIETLVRYSALKKSGPAGYVLALISSLGSYIECGAEIKFDGETIKKNLFHISIGIGRYAGGGMKFCPKAILNDGLLDLTVVDRISRWKVVRNVAGLFSGIFVHNQEISEYETSRLSLIFDKPAPLEADGEFLGYAECVNVELLSERMKFLC